MDDDDDEVPTCPLCLEELDATDLAVKACQCGYQVCLWCLHHIREQHTARCPACRTPYEEQNFKFTEVNHEQAAKEAKERATAKKEKERREKLKEIEKERARAVAVSQQKAKNNLKHARIVQRNLVYVIGLSLTLAREEVIRRTEMFGKYGRMARILINRAHPFNADAPGGPSISAYIQYARDSDASAAARGMNNAVFDGREIRCAIATTKYCDSFVRSITDPTVAPYCGNQHCMYYHSIAPEGVMSREEVLARQLGPPPPAHLFAVDQRTARIPMTNYHRQTIQPMTGAPGTSPPPSISFPSTASHARLPSPRSQVPVGPGRTINPSHNQTHHGVPSSSNASHSVPIPIATNGTSYQQHLASSPPTRPGQSPLAGKKPPSISPSPSLHFPTPASPPPSRRPVPRLNRSPNSLTQRAPAMSNGTGGAGMATSPPSFFDSSKMISTQLPSTAGWASSNTMRNTSKPVPRKPISSGTEEPRGGRPRIQTRRPRENAPPGFEESSAFPAKPPGFEGFDGGQTKRFPKKQVGGRSTDSGLASPPPGFGPGPASPRAVASEELGMSDAAVAWAQEASTDEVFSNNNRKARRSIGQSGVRLAPGPKDEVDSKADLAQVLAKIGGDLGVSSEFQNLEPPKRNNLSAVEDRGSDRRKPSTVGSLFTSQPFQAYGQSPPAHVVNSDPGSPVPQTSVYASSFSAPFGRGSGGRKESNTANRRCQSRFGFARQDAFEQRAPVFSQPITNPVESGSLGARTQFHNLQDVSSSDIGMYSWANPTNNTDSSRLADLANSLNSTHNQSTATSQLQRQTRSRFDFAGRAASPPKVPVVKSNGIPHVPNRARMVTKSEFTGDAVGATFANLTTAEKLASIFNVGQRSGDKLPPMPSYGHEVEPLPNQTEIPVKKSKTNGNISLSEGRKPGNISSSGQVSPPSANNIATKDEQFAPPGFKEATPGTPPDSTQVDVTSTSSGVANIPESGGESKTSEKGAVLKENESNDSFLHLSEDDKKEKTPRKKDKKMKNTRDTPVSNVDEVSVVKNTQPLSGGKSDQPETARRDGKEVKQAKMPAKSKEAPKQMKIARLPDDPGRFMSVAELEREVEAARVREAKLQDKLQELQRRIRSYDHVRT